MSDRIPAKSSILAYFHCGNCLRQKPEGISPAEWVKLEAGWTRAGLQVRCMRCDLNIIHIDFEGQKHPANLAGKDAETEAGEPIRHAVPLAGDQSWRDFESVVERARRAFANVAKLETALARDPGSVALQVNLVSGRKIASRLQDELLDGARRLIPDDK